MCIKYLLTVLRQTVQREWLTPAHAMEIQNTRPGLEDHMREDVSLRNGYLTATGCYTNLKDKARKG